MKQIYRTVKKEQLTSTDCRIVRREQEHTVQQQVLFSNSSNIEQKQQSAFIYHTRN
jgi:hypothetical protein